MRLMTYNIHGCVGGDGRADPERVLEVIRACDADVVALQEVHVDEAADRNFLRGLEELNYRSMHHGETMRKSFGPYGNVLMSRFEATAVDRVDLSVAGLEPRGAIRMCLQTPAGPMRVTATHLGLTRRERAWQIARLLEEPQNDPSLPDVLLGDFNEWALGSPNLKRLWLHYPLGASFRTFPARWPLLALDRIFVRGIRGQVRFWRIDSGQGRIASDHRAVLAEITTPG